MAVREANGKTHAYPPGPENELTAAEKFKNGETQHPTKPPQLIAKNHVYYE
jgi:hypothetical protein